MQCRFLSVEGAKIYFPDANYLLVSTDIITGNTPKRCRLGSLALFENRPPSPHLSIYYSV